MSRRHKDPEPEPTATPPSAYTQTGSVVPASDAGTPEETGTDAVTAADPGAPESTDAAGSSAAAAPPAAQDKPSRAPRQTLAGRVWVALAVAAVLLVLVIIFIAENTKSITISFLGAHGHISEALALLLAVVVGIVICLLVGTARILQLSLEVRRQKRVVRKLS